MVLFCTAGQITYCSTGSRFATRFNISRAALFVNVSNRIFRGSIPLLSRYATRYVSVRVFPAGRGNYKDRSRRRSHRRELLFVELSGVINVDGRGYQGRIGACIDETCASWSFGFGLQTQGTAATRRSQITLWRCRIAAQTRCVELATGIEIRFAATVLGRHQWQHSIQKRLSYRTKIWDRHEQAIPNRFSGDAALSRQAVKTSMGWLA